MAKDSRQSEQLEGYVLNSLRAAAEIAIKTEMPFPPQRWIRKLRRDVAHRWPNTLGPSPGMLSEMDMLTVLRRLDERGSLRDLQQVKTALERHGGPEPPYELAPGLDRAALEERCWYCGLAGHWKSTCPELRPQLRSGAWTLGEEGLINDYFSMFQNML